MKKLQIQLIQQISLRDYKLSHLKHEISQMKNNFLKECDYLNRKAQENINEKDREIKDLNLKIIHLEKENKKLLKNIEDLCNEKPQDIKKEMKWKDNDNSLKFDDSWKKLQIQLIQQITEKGYQLNDTNHEIDTNIKKEILSQNKENLIKEKSEKHKIDEFMESNDEWKQLQIQIIQQISEQDDHIYQLNYEIVQNNKKLKEYEDLKEEEKEKDKKLKYEIEINNLLENKNYLIKENQDLQEKYIKETEKICEKNKEIENFYIKEYSKNKEELLTNIENLKEDKNTQRKTIKDFEIKISSLEKELKTLNSKFIKKEEDFKSLLNELDEIQAHLSNITDKDKEKDKNVIKTTEKLLLTLEDLVSANKKFIAQGAFGKVQRIHVKDKYYAVKTISENGDKKEEEIQREIKIWKIIDHPKKPKAIPNFYQFLKEKVIFGTIYHMIFDFFPQSLKRKIEKEYNHSPFPFEKIYKFFTKLLNSLAFLQTLNICHRDLKPDNILLDKEENIYLIDFSESQEIITSVDETKKILSIVGSRKYVSPELHKAFNTNIDVEKFLINPYKSDVFSLGLIFLELGSLDIKINEFDDFNDWENNIKINLETFRDIYATLVPKKTLNKFIRLLNRCLKIDPDERTDFIDLFLEKNKRRNMDHIRAYILSKDQENE